MTDELKLPPTDPLATAVEAIEHCILTSGPNGNLLIARKALAALKAREPAASMDEKAIELAQRIANRWHNNWGNFPVREGIADVKAVLLEAMQWAQAQREQPAEQQRRARDELLRDVLAFIDEPAGLTIASISDKALFTSAMEAIERKKVDLVARLNDAISVPPAPDSFQQRVQPWMMACFGPEIAADKTERNHRFLEEALELAQASGCTVSEAHQLVDYVYNRPDGDINLEVGGVMVTLAAHCLAHGIDMHAAGDAELARISTPPLIEKIRAKQAAKPKYSPLPEAPAPDSATSKERIGKKPFGYFVEGNSSSASRFLVDRGLAYQYCRSLGDDSYVVTLDARDPLAKPHP